jgi:hypothetical protein
MPLWAWLLTAGAVLVAVLAALAIRHYPDDNSF